MHARLAMCLRCTVLALCCATAVAWLQVSMGPSPVRAQPGQRVLLECLFGADYPPLELEQLQVRWRHEGRVVLEFGGAARTARAGLSLAEDEVRNGNASLLLQSAAPSDSGDWTCDVLYPPDRAQGSIALHVADLPVPPMLCARAGGAPPLPQLEEVIGGCAHSAGELQRRLAHLAAELKQCLGAGGAEAEPSELPATASPPRA